MIHNNCLKVWKERCNKTEMFNIDIRIGNFHFHYPTYISCIGYFEYMFVF